MWEITMEHEVRRLIAKFHRGNDKRAGEVDVTAIPIEELRRIVRPGPNDPLLYDCYRLDKGQLAALQPYVDDIIDTTQFDYDLESEAELK
jgi:hypothetical protein